MISRLALALLAVAACAGRSPPPRSWTEVAGARALVASGAETRTVEVRQAGTGCGGGGCTSVLETRPDPNLGLQYSWTDNTTGQYPGPYIGCPEGVARETLFAEWTVVELAPTAEGQRLDCSVFDDQQRRYVILRFAAPTP